MIDFKAQAKKIYSKGNSLEALRLIDQYLKQNKNDEEAILFKARILENPNIFSYLDEETQKIEPLHLIDQVIKMNPENGLAWNQKGVLLSQRKDNYFKALDCYDKALQYEPDYYYQVIYNKGCLFLEMGLFQKALVLFQKCVKHDPKNSEILFEQARACAQLHQKNEMLRCLEQAFTFSKSDYLQLMVQREHPSFNYYFNDIEFQKVHSKEYNVERCTTKNKRH